MAFDVLVDLLPEGRTVYLASLGSRRSRSNSTLGGACWRLPEVASARSTSSRCSALWSERIRGHDRVDGRSRSISPLLADIQSSVLTELHQGLTEAFMHAWVGRATRTRCELAAHVAAAVADGLALHAVSTVGWLSEPRMADALDLALDMLTTEPRRRARS